MTNTSKTTGGYCYSTLILYTCKALEPIFTRPAVNVKGLFTFWNVIEYRSPDWQTAKYHFLPPFAGSSEKGIKSLTVDFPYLPTGSAFYPKQLYSRIFGQKKARRNIGAPRNFIILPYWQLQRRNHHCVSEDLHPSHSGHTQQLRFFRPALWPSVPYILQQ